MPAAGIPLGDILADSGYSHRIPATWASPLRAAGAQLIQDLHPNDRGPRGTHHGAIIANGNLYCPSTPAGLLALIPLQPGAPPACCPSFGVSVPASLLVSVCWGEEAPPGADGGALGSGCRGGAHSVVTSVTAARAEDSSAMALPVVNAASRAATARLLTARG
jgi:hypothetical protein